MLSEAEAKDAIKNILANTGNINNPMKFIRSVIKERAIGKVYDTILACNDCKINAPLKTIGYGNLDASVMIIGDYPLEEQFLTNKKILHPFEGTKHLSYINALFEKIGINKNELYWLNTIQCYPVSNNKYRCPYTCEIDRCSIFMKYIVDVIHPSMIILLGNVALNCFKKVPMNEIHGQWIDAFTVPAMPTYSPAYIAQLEKFNYDIDKINSLKNAMYKDMEIAFEYLKNKYPNNNVTQKKER